MVKKHEVLARLKEVKDPELGVDIVGLGLVYKVSIKGGKVLILMTLTTPGCPLAGYIDKLVKEAVSKIKGVSEVEVKITFEPPWTPELMSEEVKMELGFA